MADSPSFIVRGDDGEPYGPVDLQELRHWTRENRVGLGTRVRRADGDDSWQHWQQFPELVALLAEVQATGRTMPPLPGAAPVLAPISRRMGAFLLDLVLSSVLFAGIFFILYCFLPPATLVRMELYGEEVMKGLNPAPPQIQLPSWFQASLNVVILVVPLLYYGAFHALHGRTPAKSIFAIQVVDAQGLKPTFAKALIRAAIFVVCVYFLYCIPLLYAFFNPQRRALHDIAAGTYVVER
jgi:uncharacterized RDD family membrane protein YckC